MPRHPKPQASPPPDWMEAFRAWGKTGGEARKKRMTAEARKASAKKAADARWKGISPKERSRQMRAVRTGKKDA